MSDFFKYPEAHLHARCERKSLNKKKTKKKNKENLYSVTNYLSIFLVNCNLL